MKEKIKEEERRTPVNLLELLVDVLKEKKGEKKTKLVEAME